MGIFLFLIGTIQVMRGYIQECLMGSLNSKFKTETLVQKAEQGLKNDDAQIFSIKTP